MKDTKRTLKALSIILDRYTEKMELRNKCRHGFYIPSHELFFDGRTLRGLERRGLIYMSRQDNGSRDPKYYSHWYDVSITEKGRTHAGRGPVKDEL